MKRCMLLVVVFCLLLSMTACAAVSGEGKKPEATAPGATEPDKTEPDVTQPDTTEPEVTNPTVPDVTDPEEEIELVYDMANYQWLSDIFKEKTVEEWNAMGRYTLHLGGLHTPVVMNMDGTSVLSISAFDQTVDLGTDGMADDYHDGYSPVQSIRSTYDAVVIHVSFGEMGDGSILITKNQIFKYPKEFDSSIFLWVKDDGTLGYRQTWIDPKIEIEGWQMLYYPTSRDMMMYQEGTAEIVDGELVLTAEKTVLLSDYFDLDTLFAEAKAEGWFEEYETLDELFEANRGEKEPVELVYDMSNYEWFSDILEEKDIEHWNAMGRYTLHLGGLHTPVVVNMDGTSVLSISAFDQTVDLGTDGMADDYHDGYSPVYYIRSTEDTVVINVSFGESGAGSIVITNVDCFVYPQTYWGGLLLLSVQKDGTLGYVSESHVEAAFSQAWIVGLQAATDRNEVIFEKGSAAIINRKLVLTAKETVVLSDRYDLDAMFAEVKSDRWFAEYETVDDLLAANKADRAPVELVFDVNGSVFFGKAG